MLDLRWLLEASADEGPPGREVGRIAEVDRVVFDGFPVHQQVILVRLLHAALQAKRMAAFRTLKQFGCGRDATLELRLQSCLDIDVGDLADHFLCSAETKLVAPVCVSVRVASSRA